MPNVNDYMRRMYGGRPATPAAPAPPDRRTRLRSSIDEELGQLDQFDASKSLDRYAKGAWGSISGALSQQLEDLRGSAVGAGRLDSGFYDQDQGVVVNRATQQFSDAVAQQSMNALDAQQRNDETRLDLLSSQSEQEENAFREEQARKRKRRGGIGSAIGGILGGAGGFLVGGPAGAAAGVKLGSGLGGAMASY